MENNFFQRLNENKDKFTKKQQLLAKYIKTYHRIDKNSLVLSLALRRYTKFQYNLTNRFIERNVKTYSITDDIRSPYNAINNKCIVLNSAAKEGFS